MTSKRKLIAREKITIDLDGYTIKEGVEFLQGLLNQYGPTARLSRENYSYDEGTCLALFVDEPETDQEYAIRLAKEAWNLERLEARDRAEYLRLSAKFPDLTPAPK